MLESRLVDDLLRVSSMLADDSYLYPGWVIPSMVMTFAWSWNKVDQHSPTHIFPICLVCLASSQRAAYQTKTNHSYVSPPDRITILSGKCTALMDQLSYFKQHWRLWRLFGRSKRASAPAHRLSALQSQFKLTAHTRHSTASRQRPILFVGSLKMPQG